MALWRMKKLRQNGVALAVNSAFEADVRCRGFTALFLQLVRDFLAIIQSTNAFQRQSWDVYEDIFPAVIWSDETKTFTRVKKFNNTCAHNNFLI